MMKKLFFQQSYPKLWHHHRHHHHHHYNDANISGALSTLFFSTHTKDSQPLGRWLSPLGHRISISITGDPTASVVPVLEKWLGEGKDIKKTQLQKFIRELCKNSRFTHALQISEWMRDRREYSVSCGDFADRLYLILRIHGLERAEEYFLSIPDVLKSHRVYGSLLKCYAHCKLLEKAEAIFQKIKEQGVIRTPLPYNLMMDLYSQLGNHEKLNILVQEMEEKGIRIDKSNYSIQLNAYAVTSNIKEMEKLLLKIEADTTVSMDYNLYVVVANGYLNAGLMDQTSIMLKKAEQLIIRSQRKEAYENILMSYAASGKKDEVYRVWNLYKENGMFFNDGYLMMISSLLKLDDVDGAQCIWEEWKSNTRLFDIQIPILMFKAYSKKGLWEEAEACVQMIIETGMEPKTSTENTLATGYHLSGQIEKAIETIENIVLTSKGRRKPNAGTLAASIEYLKGKGDVEAADELLKKIRAHFNHHKGVCDRNNRHQSTEALDDLGDDDDD